MIDAANLKRINKRIDRLVSEGKVAVGCACPERLTDMLAFGTHYCRDGKRIDPSDVFLEPRDSDTRPKDGDAKQDSTRE